MIDAKEIGNRLQVIRKTKGISLEELARQAEVATGTVSLCENGKTMPKLVTIDLLADVLGVDLRAFLFHEEFSEWCSKNCKFRAGEFVSTVYGKVGMVLPNKSTSHEGQVKVVYSDGTTEYLMLTDCTTDADKAPKEFFEAV